MKKLLVGLFAVTVLAVSAQAQSDEGKPAKAPHHKHHKKEMAEKMNFTAEQKAQMKVIREESKKQMDELKKNDLITVREYRERQRKIEDTQKSKFQALLTPDQKKQLETMKQERQEKHKNMKKKEDLFHENAKIHLQEQEDLVIKKKEHMFTVN